MLSVKCIAFKLIVIVIVILFTFHVSCTGMDTTDLETVQLQLNKK